MLDAFTPAKLVYSLLLLFLVFVLLREAWTMWFDKRIFVGKFDVTTASDDEAKNFALQVVGGQRVLANQIKQYQERRSTDYAIDNTYSIGSKPFYIPTESLPGLEITYQSVNFTQIFGALRRSIMSPNEIRGVVTGKDKQFWVTVDWPQAPEPKGGGQRLTSFLTPPQPSLQEAADYVACSMSWAIAAHDDDGIAALPRAQFCDFTGALNDFTSLSARANSAIGLDAGEAKRVRWRVAQLRSHYGDTQNGQLAVFPEIYRLRADLLDLLPEAPTEVPPAQPAEGAAGVPGNAAPPDAGFAKTRDELVEAQEDRVRYAMLNPKFAKLKGQDKRFAILEVARPAIVLPGNGRPTWPENWAPLLAPRQTDILKAGRAVGLIVDNNKQAWGTAFLVAPGLIITTSNVLNDANQAGAAGAGFCQGATGPTCTAPVKLGKVIFGTVSKSPGVVLVKLVGSTPDPEAPPLAMYNPLPAPNVLSGRYAMIIGYPQADARIPEGFVSRLLGTTPGVQRLLPGRVLAFGEPIGLPTNGAAQEPDFTTDISTSIGTGGGPLIDLASGRVIGMHYAGLWSGEKGKFSYSTPIPQGALDMIERARAGLDPETSQSAPVTPKPKPTPKPAAHTTTTRPARRTAKRRTKQPTKP